MEFPPELLKKVPAGSREALCGVLALDPRPAYQEDPERVYGMAFAWLNVRFTVRDGILTVREITELPTPTDIRDVKGNIETDKKETI